MTNSDPNFPSQEPHLPRETPSAARSRRRKRGQIIVPTDAEGRAGLLQSLSKRAYPSYELFVYALLCGAILGLGYILDSQALLVFGILLAPLMTPWIGLLLAAITGSVRYFFETFMALLISAALVFVIGVLSGFAVRAFLPRTLNEAFVHSSLWWPDLIVLAIAAVILTLSFVRSEDKPFLPSVMLAYELFVPLSAGGFGLGSGVAHIWPNGLLIFFVHFAWASLFGLITLTALRFLPSNVQGFALSAATALILVATLVFLMSGANWANSSSSQAIPTSLPTLTVNLPPTSAPTSQLEPSSTPLIETATPTETPAVTPVPLTFEATLPPTDTPTVTLTIEPTAVYARIISQQGGAFLRTSPNGKYIATLDNYTFVQVLPDTQELSGWTWAHVIAVKNGTQLDGWVIQLALQVATPAPNWQTSATPTTTTITNTSTITVTPTP